MDLACPVGGSVSEIQFGHDAEVPAILERDGSGDDEASCPRTFTESGVSREREVGHERERDFAGIVADEVLFDTEGDITESLGIGAVPSLDLPCYGVGIEDHLEIGVLGESSFQVDLPENPLAMVGGCTSAVAREIGEACFELEHPFWDGEGRLGGVWAVGGELSDGGG